MKKKLTLKEILVAYGFWRIIVPIIAFVIVMEVVEFYAIGTYSLLGKILTGCLVVTVIGIFFQLFQMGTLLYQYYMRKEVKSDMKTTVTLTRVYKKVASVVIAPKLLEGMTHEEIFDYLVEEYNFDEEELFANVLYEQVDFDEDSLPGVDTDRCDIYDKNDKQIYGGHL